MKNNFNNNDISLAVQSVLKESSKEKERFGNMSDAEISNWLTENVRKTYEREVCINEMIRRKKDGSWNSVNELTTRKLVAGKNRKRREAEFDAEPDMSGSLPRQLKNPKTETLVVKNNKVITIDKKDEKKYLAKGWGLAESYSLTEATKSKNMIYVGLPDDYLDPFVWKHEVYINGKKVTSGADFKLDGKSFRSVDAFKRALAKKYNVSDSSFDLYKFDDNGKNPTLYSKGTAPRPYLKESRQLKNPKTETMVVKNNKVIVIDKKDEKKYLANGWILAEGTHDNLKARGGKDEMNKLANQYQAALEKSGKGGASSILNKMKALGKALRINYKDYLEGDELWEAQKLDKVEPKQLKKDWDERLKDDDEGGDSDDDIDNDGDEDSSDRYLHKKRKAISKSMNEKNFHDDMKAKTLIGGMRKKALDKLASDYQDILSGDKKGDAKAVLAKLKSTAKSMKVDYKDYLEGDELWEEKKPSKKTKDNTPDDIIINGQEPEESKKKNTRASVYTEAYKIVQKSIIK